MAKRSVNLNLISRIATKLSWIAIRATDKVAEKEGESKKVQNG